MSISKPDKLICMRDWVRWGASHFNEEGLFFGHGTDNALDEALALVLHALHLDHSLPESFLDARLSSEESDRVFELLRQRMETRKPAAYLTHEAFFAGLSFYVNEHVLVPRSPIAELIENGFEPWLQADDDLRILDLCTGSGCIGIACAHYFPHARVDLADISPSALEVAQVNVDRYQMQQRVKLWRSDLFMDLPLRQYDLIVSNPPYVSREEMTRLPDEYAHEPALGLEAGEDGLDLVARILCQAPAYLKPDGIIIVEVGNSWERVLQRYPAVPFTWLEFKRGGHGVFLLSAEELNACQPLFQEECLS